MAVYLIERSPVTQGLKAGLMQFLQGRGLGGTDLKVEVGQAPVDLDLDSTGKLRNPYAIVHPWPSSETYGTMAHPESGARLLYQITSVGRTDESAGIMADQVRRGLLERSTNGSFLWAISAGASMTVIDRLQMEHGLAVPTVGLWNVHDVFGLEVQAHA